MAVDESTRLLLAARDGDRVALQAWIRRAQPDVWRFCAASLGADRADDVTQDVFLRAIRAVAGFRGDASARTWVLAIARRAISDELRGTYRRRALQARLEAQPVATSVEASDVPTRQALTIAVARLPEERREAFALTQVLGLSYAEAAEALDVPIGTIRSRVARARLALLDHLDVAPAADTADDRDEREA